LERGAIEIVSLGSDVAVATLRNRSSVTSVERRPPSVSNIRRRMSAAANGHERMVFFAVIEGTSIPPEQPARERFIEMSDEFGERTAVTLFTIERRGVPRGDGVRVIASGILNSVRFRMRFLKHIGGSLEDAAAHAVEHTPGRDTPAILRSLQELASKTS
jgi:hypothetical protein